MNIIASQKFCLWVLGKHQCHLVLIGRPLMSDLHCLEVITLAIILHWFGNNPGAESGRTSMRKLNPNKHSSNVWTWLDDNYYGERYFVLWIKNQQVDVAPWMGLDGVDIYLWVGWSVWNVCSAIRQNNAFMNEPEDSTKNWKGIFLFGIIIKIDHL